MRSYTGVGTQRTITVAVLAAFTLLNMTATQKTSHAMKSEVPKASRLECVCVGLNHQHYISAGLVISKK